MVSVLASVDDSQLVFGVEKPGAVLTGISAVNICGQNLFYSPK